MPMLSAQDLLAGSKIIHEIEVPPQVLMPAGEMEAGEAVWVRMRPLNVTTLTLISRAAREDTSLIPLLIIKEALVEPALSLEQIRQMHVGLVHFLVSKANQISGLMSDGQGIEDALQSPVGQTHLLLAKHFGWTPDQVSQLTPGQVAVYLAGIERLLALEKRG